MRVVVDVAGGRDDDVARAVVLVEERRMAGTVTDRITSGSPSTSRRAVAREDRLGEPLVDDVGRLVEVHQHLFQDHLPLGVDLVGAEGRLRHDVAEDVEAELEVLGQRSHVEGRVLLGRVGVHVAADRVDRPRRSTARRASGVPLNSRCSRKCEMPDLGRRLVARPGAHPEADAGRADLGHRLGDEPEAGGKAGDADHAAPPTRGPGRRPQAPARRCRGTACGRWSADRGRRSRTAARPPSGSPSGGDLRRTASAGPRSPKSTLRSRRRTRPRTRHDAPAVRRRRRRPARPAALVPTREAAPGPPQRAGGRRRPARARPCPAGRCRRRRTSTSWPSVEHVLDPLDPLALRRGGRCGAARHGPGGC